MMLQENRIEIGPRPYRKVRFFLFNECPLKLMKIEFNFSLKPPFVLHIFEFLF